MDSPRSTYSGLAEGSLRSAPSNTSIVQHNRHGFVPSEDSIASARRRAIREASVVAGVGLRPPRLSDAALVCATSSAQAIAGNERVAANGYGRHRIWPGDQETVLRPAAWTPVMARLSAPVVA